MAGDADQRRAVVAAVSAIAGIATFVYIYRATRAQKLQQDDAFDHVAHQPQRPPADAERKRQEAEAAAEAERKRQEAEAAERKRQEAERKRQEAEAERKRQEAEAAAEAERKRQEAEAAAEAERTLQREAEVAAIPTPGVLRSAEATFFRKVAAQLRKSELESSVRVGGMRVDVTSIPSFRPLVTTATVRHPLCVMTWRHKQFDGFEIRLQAEDLRHFRRPLTSAEYEREALEAINHVFGNTEAVQVVESCRAAHAVGKCAFDRFALLCVYTDSDDGSDGADVRVFTRVADGVGYTLTYTGLVDNQACADEFFEAARTCTLSPAFAELSHARADAGERLVHVRPARYRHTLRVAAPCEWVAVAHQPDTVRLAHSADPSKVATVSTSPPLASELRASDSVHRICNDLVCLHVTAAVTEDEVDQIAQGASIDAPGLDADGDDGTHSPPRGTRACGQAVFQGVECAFGMPLLPGAFVLPRVFDADPAVVTVMIPDSAIATVAPLSVDASSAADAWADVQITPVVMPAGTTIRQLGQFTANQCESPRERMDRGGKRVVIEGTSTVLGPEQQLSFHVLDTGVRDGLATFVVVRLTSPVATADRYTALMDEITATVEVA